MLGGPQAFRTLVASAIEKSLNIIVQMSPSVSATRAHRRYNGLFTHIINDAGVRVPHPGSDGRFNQWEDQALLNYRKLAVWNLLLEEVGGIYFSLMFGIAMSPLCCPHLRSHASPCRSASFTLCMASLPCFWMNASPTRSSWRWMWTRCFGWRLTASLRIPLVKSWRVTLCCLTRKLDTGTQS
jgi:hypothetical protein